MIVEKLTVRYEVVLGSDGWSIWDHQVNAQAPQTAGGDRKKVQSLCNTLNRKQGARA